MMNDCVTRMESKIMDRVKQVISEEKPSIAELVGVFEVIKQNLFLAQKEGIHVK